MNIILKLICLILLSFRSLTASAEKESIDQISLQAQALWEARDYQGAQALYEILLSQSLPAWQQIRLQYNQATLFLALKQFNKAIETFQTISPYQFSLPRFSRDFFLNNGISYLQYANSLETNSPFFNQQLLYFKQSLENLNQAKAIGCQIHEMEEAEKNSCSPQHLNEKWIQTALSQFEDARQKKTKAWMQAASVEALASYLSILLQQLMAEAKAFQELNQDVQSLDPWFTYFRNQAETLVSLWEALKQKKFTSQQLASFDQAASAYLNALKFFSENNFSDALKSLSQSYDKLGMLSYKENIDLQLAHLNLEILLLQPSFTTGDIQGVEWEVDQLKADKDRTQSIEGIQRHLTLALQATESKDFFKARFFLLAGFAQLDSLIVPKDHSPISYLKYALKQANLSLQSLLLSLVIPQVSLPKEQWQTILREEQEAVLTRADFFIPAVLKEQELRYHNTHHPESRCQQSPWDQVVPLFDNGYLAAKSASKLLALPSPDLKKLAAQQQQTLQDWQQALQLLQTSVKQQMQPISTKSGSSSSPKNLAETLRLIQEMYLEDQYKPEPKITEMHSW